MLSYILAMAAAAAPQPHSADPSSAWPHYANARYGYDVCYSTAFTPEPEADAGDGRKFAGPDGAQMLIFGQFNAADSTLAQWAESQAKTYTGKRAGKITHRALHPGLAVISGSDGKGNLFYTRTLAKGDRFVSLQFRYPARQAKRFQPIIEQTARCLTLTG